MTPYDWAMIAILGVFIVRGWRRGVVREAIEVALLLFGTVIVFRMSPLIGTIVSGMANLPYEVGRVIAGGIIFVALVVGSIVAGRLVAQTMRVVPGARSINRFGGSAVGLVYAAVVVILGTTLLSASPVPESVGSSVDDAIEASPVGSFIVDPTGPVQPMVTVASGQTVLTSIIAVQHAVGDRLIAGTLPIPFPAPERAALSPSQSTAQAVFDDLNRERISAGHDPLAWSPDLAIVAVSRATNVYVSGFLNLDDDLPEAIRAAGIPGTISGDLVVMAASVDGLVEAITTTRIYEDLISDPVYRKAGVGVIEGPYGLIAVQVLSG